MKTKDKILKTALQLFAEQGIDKTSTAQITKAVGVSTGALFVHFKTKKELIDTIYIGIKHYSLSGIDQHITPFDSVETNVKRIGQVIIEYFLAHYDQFVFLELVENDPQISVAALEAREQEYHITQKYLQRWQMSGEVRNIDLHLLYSLLWSVLSTLIRYGHQQKWESVQASYLDVVWDTVRR
jgi:AcrR family transcriptional regulator